MGEPLRVEQGDGCGITVSRMERGPYHQPRKLGRPFGFFYPYSNMLPLATMAVRRIQRIRLDENCGAVIVGWIENKTMPISILSAASIGTDAAVRGNPALVIGWYANVERKAGDPPKRSDEWRARLFPSPERLLQDLTQHALDLGLLSEADLYGDLRYAEDA